MRMYLSENGRLPATGARLMLKKAPPNDGLAKLPKKR